MEGKKLKVVQIGTAHDHAADIIDTMHALPEDYAVIGVCEEDESLRNAAKARRSYDGTHLSYERVRWLSLRETLDMSGELDAVIIETDELNMIRYAQMFANCGLAIHMDKPGGEDFNAFKNLVNTMKSQNLPFHVGYMYRYNEAIKYSRQLVESGSLGDIFSVEAQMSVLHNAGKREWLKKFQSGMMFFLGCHMIDLVYMFCKEPEEVIPFNTSTYNDGLDSKDYGFAVFKYKNGISFVKSCASEVNGFYRRQLVITGTKGTILIEPIESRTGGKDIETVVPIHISFFEDGMKNQFGKSGKEEIIGPFGRYTEMMKDFARIVRGEKLNDYSYEYELAVQKLILQACGIIK